MGVEFCQWLIAFLKDLDIRQTKTVRSRHRYRENCECVDTLSTPRFHREVKVAQNGILSQQLDIRFPEGFPPAMKKKSCFVEQSMKWYLGFRGLEDSVDTECNKKKRGVNFSSFWTLYMNPALGLEWISYAIDVQIMKRHWGWKGRSWLEKTRRGNGGD